ncbi:ATP-binding protein [Prevotella lacticifex]|uniref:ATP-binding protein n=1 Tax=Prevotella lacticifex TaxID=2854755 RepID=UPI001CC747BC|nr:ATP-binding protein [Prevotella lacticifex]GJG36826.1 ATPase [Prevotella lacticifex]GJG42632.1 ATPase [Prevotella lacticifex]GJG45042.1 ATPase [Prevotella lacticifex]GJG54602.1 ATPase [Prevotella lacticifex]
MMEFIDRNNEQRRLIASLSSDASTFVVLYGRRRLGKSTLIRKVLNVNDVYYEASQSETATQINMLSKAIAMVYDGFDRPLYPSWEDIILAFNHRCEKNATLVLDEFPYMVYEDSSLPSTLQRIVDRRVVDGDGLRCNIVICGSSQRMMQSLIRGSEPLYGRADEEFCLKPIRLPHWHKAMAVDSKSAIEEYSVWGGVPQYWAQRERYGSFEEALDSLVLNEHGVMYNEPSRLFRDDSPDIAPYSSIMTAIGSGRHRYSDIANAVGKSTAELSKPIKNLTEMAFIRKEVPFGESEKKTKKTLYYIDDPFMAFYYKFVEPYKSTIAMGRTGIVKKMLEQSFHDHVGGTWERLCQIAVSGNNLFGHTWKVASRWWGKVPVYEEGRKTPVGNENLELDVVAEDQNDSHTILVGECKWTGADYADRLLDKLRTKVSKAPFAKGKKVVYVLFLREQPLSVADCNILLPDDVMLQLPE